MTGITMYDSAFNSQFPASPQAVAGYVDGGVGNQPNYDYLVSAFPAAQHLSIALFPGDGADCLDVETGAASPADIPVWVARQVARGVVRPVIYANVSTMETQIVPLVTTLPGARAAVRLWTAHYGALYGPAEHICGPDSCGALSIPADGTQWNPNANGLTLDQSLLNADFFGTPAPVQTWEDKLMATIATIQNGSADTQAVKNWQGLLVARGYDIGTTGTRKDGVDGSFGVSTETATRAFQTAAKIGVDGVVGQQTWTAALT